MRDQTPIHERKAEMQTLATARTGLLQRKCACGGTPGVDGECEECREKRLSLQHNTSDQQYSPISTPTAPLPGHSLSRIQVYADNPTMLQTKLVVNEPGDKYEQEADQVAEQVMRMPEPESPHGIVASVEKDIHIQRVPLGKEEPNQQLEEEKDEQQDEEQPEEAEEALQAKESPGQTPTITPELQTRISSIKGGGQPLPESTRTYMEPRFGHDFSQVRVHTDGAAAETAQAVKARAFTLGSDIVFGSGAYTPGTAEGKKLLAHELTHVVQQKPRVHQVSFAMLQRQVDPAEVKEALASIQVEQRTEKKILLRPAKIFELVPKNTPQKRDAYNRVQKALNQLRRARDAAQLATNNHKAKELQKAKTAYEKAEKELLAAMRSLKAFVESQIGKAETKKAAGEKLGKAGQSEEKTTPIEGDIYEPGEVERIYYDIVVDGEKISLYDHVDAYATVFEKGLEGKATSESKDTVRNMLEKSGLSESHKKILKTISTAEGGFTSINTWDKAVLTWGMVQWTGGDKSDLTAALTIIKEVAPDAFKKRFQKYGIDVENNKLVIVSGEGTISQGKEAAKAVGESPTLTAVMSRAGLDPDIQIAELKAASKLEIDNPLNKKLQIEIPKEPEPKVEKTGKVTAKGKKRKAAKTFVAVRLGDIFTSEYGVGVLADQVVHGGFPGGALKRALTKYLKEHGLDPRDHTKWAADAEKALIPVIAKWPDRAKALEKNGCSKDPGTFR